MYKIEEIKAACVKSGINSVATDILEQVLLGNDMAPKSIIPFGNETIHDGVIMKQIEGTSYYVSEDGRIFNQKRMRFVIPQPHGKYLIFNQSNGVYQPNQKSRKMRIHIMVATYFVPNPENKKFVNHKDTITTNNHFSNLEWVTATENNAHYKKFCKKEIDKAHPTQTLTDTEIEKIRLLRSMGISLKEIGRVLHTTEVIIGNYLIKDREIAGVKR